MPASFHDGLFSTDSSARLVLQQGEQQVATLQASDGINNVIIQGGGRPFAYPSSVDERVDWVVIFTDRRLICWSPLADGIFGGFKQKNGQATGGYFEYKDIVMIMMVETPRTGHVRVAMQCKTGSGSDAAMMTFDAEPAQAQAFLQQLAAGAKLKAAKLPPAVAAAGGSTIDRFVAAALAKFPTPLNKSLAFQGNIPVVLDENDRIDKALTDVEAYAASGVTFS